MSSWEYHHLTRNCLLPYVDAEQASPEIKEALETLPFERNIFKLLANAPTMFPAFMKLLASCWSADNGLRPSDWQLVVLRTGSLLDCPYEWFVNEPVAKLLGFDEPRLALIRRGDLSSPALFTDRQRLISTLIDEMHHHDAASKETVLKAKEAFGDQGVMELMFINGVYSMIAKIMQSCHIDFDPEIPGLEDILRKINAKSIEKERSFEG